MFEQENQVINSEEQESRLLNQMNKIHLNPEPSQQLTPDRIKLLPTGILLSSNTCHSKPPSYSYRNPTQSQSSHVHTPDSSNQLPNRKKRPFVSFSDPFDPPSKRFLLSPKPKFNWQEDENVFNLTSAFNHSRERERERRAGEEDGIKLQSVFSDGDRSLPSSPTPIKSESKRRRIKSPAPVRVDLLNKERRRGNMNRRGGTSGRVAFSTSRNASFSKDFVRATSTSSQTSNHSRSSSNDSYGSFQFRSAVSLPTVPKYNHNHKARSKQPEDIERMMGGLSVSRD